MQGAWAIYDITGNIRLRLEDREDKMKEAVKKGFVAKPMVEIGVPELDPIEQQSLDDLQECHELLISMARKLAFELEHAAHFMQTPANYQRFARLANHYKVIFADFKTCRSTLLDKGDALEEISELMETLGLKETVAAVKQLVDNAKQNTTYLTAKSN